MLSLMWGLGGSMDAKGRAELGELLTHRSGLSPPPDGAELTTLQVRTLIPRRSPHAFFVGNGHASIFSIFSIFSISSVHQGY